MEDADADLPPTQKQTKAVKFPCIRCKKSVAKNSKSVKCHICQQWVHVDCEGMPPELYNILANPEKYGTCGMSWSCSSCQASAAKVLEVVNAYEKRITEVESRVTSGEGKMNDMGKELEKMKGTLKDRDDKIDQKLDRKEKAIFDELRQRDSRRMNVIMHGVSEIDKADAAGSERREWDRAECLAILETLRMGMEDSDVKFTRRLGEAASGRGPRPLCVGFFSDGERDKVLRRARDLEKSKFKEVSICADLTWKQREEEADLVKEAGRRNEKELTEEDKAKNLIWAVVGAKGQKRLVKTTARPQGEPRPLRGGWQGRGRGSHQRTSQDERRGLRRARSESEERTAPPGKK